MRKVEVIVKNYVVRDRNFVIVRDEEGFYMAIEDKYIDPDGRLNKVLYGFQMNASKELAECLKSTENQVEIDYLVSHGHDLAEAFAIRFNLMDNIEGLRKAFS